MHGTCTVITLPCPVPRCMYVDNLRSLLEQLRAEMQSGTFDLKQAGAYTETLTLDASFAAARQLQQVDSTPAPASAAELRAAAAAAGAGTGARPASAMLPGIASCLKGSNTATAGAGAGVSNTILEHTHAARAVTFAADVHDAATTEEYGRRHASSAGTCSALLKIRMCSSQPVCMLSSMFAALQGLLACAAAGQAGLALTDILAAPLAALQAAPQCQVKGP